MQKIKKTILILLAFIFVLSTVAGSLFYAKPVRAQLGDIGGIAGGGISDYDWGFFMGSQDALRSAEVAKVAAPPAGMPVVDTARKAETYFDRIIGHLKSSAWKIIGTSAMYFSKRVAYDTAVWLASGGNGQSPLYYATSFGDYLGTVADDTFGVALEQLGKPYGLNLCKIPDARLDLAMRVGIQMKYLRGGNISPIKPACTWSEFKENWGADNWRSMYGSGEAIEERFNMAFKPEQSDLGIMLSATEKIDNLIKEQTYAKQLQREEGDGYRAKTAPISEQIVTPPQVVKKEGEEASPSKLRKDKWDILLSSLGNGATDVAGFFLSTLVKEMMDNWQTRGMFPLGIACVDGDLADFSTYGNCNRTPGGDLLGQYEGLVTGGRREAQQLFSKLLFPEITEIDRYDTLANLSSCPDTPGPDNCVADENLVDAAQEASAGRPVTIAEALAKGWLRKEWKLLPPERSDNSDKNCYQRAYCYANIVKLRKFRILPLGFEIAAQNSDPDKPWILDEVVKGFNDCEFIKDAGGKVIGVVDDPVGKPFCRLIDPNWIIKAPIARCNAMAYGSSEFFPGAGRTKECVDSSSCVAYDKNGNCASYGYCVREKNVWKIDSERCEAQNRTCRSFADSSGKTVSYLYRTLDTGYCNQDNIGCAAYSLIKNASNTWLGYDPQYSAIGENSEIHFNNRLSSNCSSNSAGCSAFVTASTSEKLYIKKAPLYSKCYDSDPSTLAIEWPKSKSDLVKISDSPECSKYSAACLSEETSCDWYDPVTYVGERIPGKFKPAEMIEGAVVWNDQCSKKCVGYSAYIEMPSNYSNGSPVEYIIPASGAKCSASEEGCASFTNLGTTVGGMEKVETYSYLRPCITPDKDTQKTFYTYEGSTVGGYQLRVFVLEKNSDGSPKYFYRTKGEEAAYEAECNEPLYKSGGASVDCRQFNDDNGNVYYKLLSKTIAVSESCAPYRLNNTELYEIFGLDASSEEACLAKKGLWEGGKCKVCFQNGEYKDGSCLYNGLPSGIANTAGESRSCSAQAVSCRAYKGNAGNNIRNIFYDNFEGSTSLSNWASTGGSFSQSTESTHVGEHSLSFQGAASGYLYKSLDLKPEKTYSLTFWAKGTSGKNINISLNNGEEVSFGSATVADEWRFFKMDPVELKGSATSTRLEFASLNSNIYFDNVRLTAVGDYLYIVKDSLKVDQICDSNLNDNLPGEALGCAEYKKTNGGAPVYITGFNYLCREKAIGCTALYDTKNTEEPGALAYNVFVTGTEGMKVQKTIKGAEYSCEILLGQNGCYFNVKGASIDDIAAGGGIITTSTVYVGSDTPAAEPVYLVANKEATCSQLDIGCVYAGRRVDTPVGAQYQETLIKNDPASYNTSLCQSEAVGCNEYSFGDGKMYFKDPAIAGQKICSYRKDATIGSEKFSGWFWKGVGKCSGPAPAANKYCVNDSDCDSGAKCENKDEQPCYPAYLQAGNIYGLWSYGTSGKYENFVGECPASQNGCTEFVDHNDNDQKYYLIDDERLKLRQSECNGQVSQKYGCILLDKTDQPNKFWTASSSYHESEKVGYDLVVPSDTAQNDSNVILKVTKDRECGEWLQCKSSHRVLDAKSGKYKEVCDAIGRCDNVIVDNKGEITNCSNWIDGLHEASNQILSDSFYRNRDVSWMGLDYSGYSLLNTYPVEELSEVNMVNSGDDWRLVKKIPCGSVNCRAGEPKDSFKCQTKKQACGSGSRGICSDSYLCVQTPEAGTADVMGKSPDTSCRAYPEENSPFPSNKERQNMSGFGNVKVCQESYVYTTDKKKAYACECDYTKVKYGDADEVFWNYSQPNSMGIQTKDGRIVTGIVPGICSGGASDGFACSVDSDCGDGSSFSGTCNQVKQEIKPIGWRGYCLEPDISRQINGEANNFACLTWYPKESISGALDINSQHVEAGYVRPGFSGKYYCLGAKGNQILQPGTSDTYSYEEKIGTQTIFHNTSVRYCSNGMIQPAGRTVSNGIANVETEGTDWCNENSDCESASLGTVSDRLDGGLNAWCPLMGDKNFDREKRIYYVHADKKYDIDEIDYIKIQAYSDDGGWFEQGDASHYSTFYIRNGLKTKYNGSIWSVIDKNEEPINSAQKLKNELTTMQFGRYVLSDGTERTQWDLRYDDGGGDGQDQYQFADATGQDVVGPFSDLLKSGGDGDKDAGVTAASSCESIENRGHDKFQMGCLGGGKDNYDDGCAIRVSFRDGKFDRIYFSCYTGDGEDKEWARFNIFVGLRESCTSIAQVENSAYDAVGWTDRLWNRSTYMIPQMGYFSSSTAASPFGSLPVEMPQNKLVNIYSVYNKYTFNPPPAVVGAPYACGASRDCLQIMPTVSSTKNNAGASRDSADVAGKDRVAQIFAQVKNLWTWQQTGRYYTEKGVETTVSDLTMNRTETATNKDNAPKIRHIGSCAKSGKCLEPSSEGLTVNGKSSGDVVFQSHSAPVNIKFYGYADKDQMPLKKVTVDWNDGESVALNGYFRNHRGAVNGTCDLSGTKTCKILNPGSDPTDTRQSCVSSNDCKYLNYCQPEDLASNFGQIQDRTCDNAYFRFDHVYQCIKDGVGWKGNTGPVEDQCPYADYKNDPNMQGCCVFTPKVKAKDNWGWCNGECTESDRDSLPSPGVDGCYDKSWNIIATVPVEKRSYNECEVSADSWTPYGSGSGKIIIPPAQE